MRCLFPRKYFFFQATHEIKTSPRLNPLCDQFFCHQFEYCNLFCCYISNAIPLLNSITIRKPTCLFACFLPIHLLLYCEICHSLLKFTNFFLLTHVTAFIIGNTNLLCAKLLCVHMTKWEWSRWNYTGLLSYFYLIMSKTTRLGDNNTHESNVTQIAVSTIIAVIVLKWLIS